MRKLASVVWHSGPFDVLDLLKVLDSQGWTIVVTFNLKNDSLEQEINASLINIIIEKNLSPLTFAQNHNKAFRKFKSDLFLVINPDIAVYSGEFQFIRNLFLDREIGVAGPVFSDLSGKVSFGRSDITVLRFLFDRLIFRKSISISSIGRVKGSNQFYYETDFISGAFMLFRSRVFEKVCGFDERYLMYCEDSEICRRIHRHQYKVIVCPHFACIHRGGYASHRSIKYFVLHLRSLLVYLATGWGKK